MPLPSCPIDEPTLAEYALGPGRSRLDPATDDRVVAHLAGCQSCREDYASYLQIAHQPLAPDAFTAYADAHGIKIDPDLDTSARNVLTRAEAGLRRYRKNRERLLLKRVAAVAVVAALVGAVVAFGAYKRYFTPTPSRPTLSMTGGNTTFPPDFPGTDVTFAATSSDDAAAAEWSGFKQRADAANPAEALELLARKREELVRAPETVADAWLPRLVSLHEQLIFRTTGTPVAGEALLSLSRVYGSGGFPAEGRDAFRRYADFRGEAARQTALAQNEPPAEAARAAQRARASAYYDEALRCYEQKDFTASLNLCEQLAGRYPSSIKAYEGQIIAARCHLANRQPDGAIACYQRIVAHCPDQRFARAAAETVMKFLAEAGRGDEAIRECRRLRERFTDDEFRQAALFMEGRLLKEKGGEHYPEAIALLQDARKIRPDSPCARQAEVWIKTLRDEMFKQLLPADPEGKG